MKAIVLVNKIPFPANDGGAVAAAALIEDLIRGDMTITLIAFSTPKHPVVPEKMPSHWKNFVTLLSYHVDTKITIRGIIGNIFSQLPYNVERIYKESIKHDLLQRIETIHADLIILDGLFPLAYLQAIHQKFKELPIIYRAHNVESNIWKLQAAHSNNPLKKIFLSRLADKLQRLEKQSISAFDAILSISREDSVWFKNFGFNKPIHNLLPVNFNGCNRAAPLHLQHPFKLFHLGSMDWEPNADGIRWFIRDIFPTLKKIYPDIEFHIAGKNMPEDLLQTVAENVYIQGEVESFAGYAEDKDILIVPLRAGSGVRIKILEALCLGIPVISTRLGASGLPVRESEDFIAADSAEEWVEALNEIDKLMNCARSGHQKTSRLMNPQYRSAELKTFLISLLNE